MSSTQNGEAKNVCQDMKDFYGKKLDSKDDFQTTVCGAKNRRVPAYLREAMAAVHDDIQTRYFGCGIIDPGAIDGCSVLDLGCGSGMDCFVLSKLVGQDGHVTGLDMTNEQLEVARKYEDYHTKKWGYERPNVEFVHGYLENLEKAGIQEGFYDLIISNCVICLCVDKEKVLQEAYRALKPGGEFYLSDMYCDQELPDRIRDRKDLWGEGIGGAMAWDKLHELAEKVGFATPRLVDVYSFAIKSEEIARFVDGYKYVAATYRLYKLTENERKTASSTVTYRGTIPNHEQELAFDHKHTFKTSVPQHVDGQLAAILKNSRFRDHFKVAPSEPKDEDQVKVNPFAVLCKTKCSK